MKEVNYMKVSTMTQNICRKMLSILDNLSTTEFPQCSKWTEKLKSVIPDSDAPLTIALVGEYDVGKSSIIKALTGKDVLINSNVATSEVKIFQYQGLKLIDLPGTLSGLEEHDEMAFRAAADSDLLIYVITNELFNSYNIQAFFDTMNLLKKSKQCMLVINQIDRVNLMDRSIDEAIGIMKEELTIRLQPYNIEQFSPIFISARNYIDSLEEDDDEIKSELYESSRITSLIDGLNTFCFNNRIIGRLSSPLQSILAILDSIRIASSDEGNEFDILNNYYSRQKRIFNECENKIKGNFNKLRIQKKQDILGLCLPIVQAFERKADPTEIEEVYDEADERLQEMIDSIADELQKSLKEPITELQEKLEEFENSPVSGEVKEIIYNAELKIDGLEMGKKPVKIPEELKGNIKRGIDDLGKAIGDNADDLAKHFVEIYKNMTKTKFKPYGKIKMTDKVGKVLGKAGKVLGWLAVGWDLYCNVKEELDRDKWDKQLREFKAETKQKFVEVAKDFEQTIIAATDTFLKDEIQSKIKSIDAKRDELLNTNQNNKQAKKKIKDIEDEINAALMEINTIA
ncbi:GTPase [Clostridium sp. 'White wine YQ']|uniref:GTPase n=1 Tax=Clostridium sp. 'White wine YQ' TaxID=3027474 RepID=UPI002365B86C|nr:GTPase domain-containing protein [Clostridium sp. 'White wine YQ']MDD7793825.1 GTPase domain-containing protein [Clostridium sp. 'White wine YQ']